MVKDNFIIKNEKPFEIVQEVSSKYETPSFEEFMKTYESNGNVNYTDLESSSVGEVRGCGPCVYTWCGCDCSSRDCNCPSAEASIYKNGTFSTLNYSASGKARIGKEGSEKDYIIANGQASRSLFRIKEPDGDLKILSESLEGEIGPNRDGYTARVRAGADLISFKTIGFEGRAGLNVDTGFKAGDEGLEVKAAGFGLSVGKKMGVSTPFGEIKFDTDECVVQ